MNQTEKRRFLIRRLLDEQPRYRDLEIPSGEAEQRRLLRSLFNLRMPGRISEDFLTVQDEYLQEETRRKGVTALADLTPMEPGLYPWQGDVTTLRCDATVSAANSGIRYDSSGGTSEKAGQNRSHHPDRLKHRQKYWPEDAVLSDVRLQRFDRIELTVNLKSTDDKTPALCLRMKIVPAI